MKNSRLLTIFLIVFVDLLGFSLILPQLPYYAESFGATQVIVGFVGGLLCSRAACWSAAAGTPVRPHRPTSSAVAFGQPARSWAFCCWVSPPRWRRSPRFWDSSPRPLIIAILFFSRILAGLTGGNITVAQAYIADVTDEQNRAKGLGLIGAAFGLGFIIGPAAGGILSQWGYSVPAFTAAGVAILNFIAIFFLLPESLTAERREEIKPGTALLSH